MVKILELSIVMACCLAPIFILASEVSGDEYSKAATGVLMGGTFAAMLAAYQIWSKKKADVAKLKAGKK